MRCPRCGFDNREGVRFCEECGGKLEQACPGCGTAVPPGRKFCGGCGQPLVSSASSGPTHTVRSPESYTPRHLAEKILTSKAALEGERKQVTVRSGRA
jgi:predicted amidophosphoribosyltransferase